MLFSRNILEFLILIYKLHAENKIEYLFLHGLYQNFKLTILNAVQFISGIIRNEPNETFAQKINYSEHDMLLLICAENRIILNII